MRVALVMATLPNPRRAFEGGVTYSVHGLANALVEHGQEVVVFSLDPRPPDAIYHHRFIPAPSWVGQHWFARYFLLSLYIRALDFSGFDVLHTNGEDWLIRRDAPPRVRTFWGSAVGEAKASTRLRRFAAQAFIQYPLEWASACLADERVGISKVTARQLPMVNVIIPPGVDTERFRPRKPKSAIPSILFVGDRLGGRKRGRLLLQAYQEYVRPRYPTAELWMRSSERTPVEGVRWIDTVPTDEATKLAELYSEAWIMCLPSSYEGFGIPYVEALAAGTAVVATPNGGAEEILRDNAHGVLTSPRNLGPALVDLIGDRARLEALWEGGPRRARDYSWPSVAERYVAVYRSVAARQ